MPQRGPMVEGGQSPLLSSQQPPVEVVEEHYSARCPKAVPFVFCCLSGLLFTVAAILVVKHHGHVHMPRHFHGFRPHHGMHLGPWKLPIILLSATMLCGVAALTHFCRKVSQRGQAVEDGQSPPQSKYLKGAAFASFFLGVLLVIFGIVGSTGGHHFLHHVHFLHGHHAHHTLHLIFMVSLLAGVLSIAASFILYNKKTSPRVQVREEHDQSRRSSCRKRALIVVSIVLAMLLVKGAVLAAHGRLHLPTHFHGFRPHHHGHHGHHGPREWQTMSDSDMEDGAEEGKGSERQEGDDEGDEYGSRIEGKGEGQADTQASFRKEMAIASDRTEMMIDNWKQDIMSVSKKMADKVQHVIV